MISKKTALKNLEKNKKNDDVVVLDATGEEVVRLPGSGSASNTEGLLNKKDVKKKKLSKAEVARISEEIELLEQKTELMYGLPYLYAWKHYRWSREFFESRNKLNFLTAGNQLGKSSIAIRKCIHWATDKSLWKELWQVEPKQFWYLYPSRDVVNFEFKLKWSQFLPRGKFKDDHKYGWRELKDHGDTVAIQFNTGVTVVFKTYSKSSQNLQTASVDCVFCDEELPDSLYNEIAMRLNANSGYFHLVFTATLGQDLWRKTMEPRSGEVEMFPQAAKWTVSLYDCLQYEDGTNSPWTIEKIREIEAKCKSEAEILKRVHGRFIMVEGRKYPSFNPTKHVKPWHPIPENWLIYSGVDIGSGGEKGHPSAIVFVAVRPDYRAARVIAGWRGDGVETTDSDVVLKYIEMKKKYNIKVVAQYYDYASKDFEIISRRMGESFLKADKSKEKGDGIINVLFKNDMLFIYEDDELIKLANELSVLTEAQSRVVRKAQNDFCFIAGTKIKTNNGNRNIEEIIAGDLVHTRFGLKKVVNIGKRKENLYKVCFSNGESLTGTSDHPVFTKNKGFVKISDLTRSDIIYTYDQWLTSKFLTESHLEDTQTQNNQRTEDITEAVLEDEHVLVSFVENLNKTDFVYNIEVENAPEYFANGVLVHNCDGLRYALSSIPFDFSHITGAPVEGNVNPDETKGLNSYQIEVMERRKAFVEGDAEEIRLEEEFNEINESYG